MVSIDSIFTDVRDRAKNPFFATLIVVWLYRNWELVYTIFNFDDDSTLLYKQLYIRKYFASLHFWEEFFINIGFAVLFLIIGHFFKLFTDLLATAIRHRFKPHLNSIVSSKLIANSNDLEVMRKKRDLLIDEIRALRDEKTLMDDNNSKLNIEITNKQNEINTRDFEIAQNKTANGELQHQLNLTSDKLNISINEIQSLKSDAENTALEILNSVKVLKNITDEKKYFFEILTLFNVQDMIIFENLIPKIKSDKNYIINREANFKRLYDDAMNKQPAFDLPESLINSLVERKIITIKKINDIPKYSFTIYGEFLVKILNETYN